MNKLEIKSVVLLLALWIATKSQRMGVSEIDAKSIG